jgi:O-antigen ligase
MWLLGINGAVLAIEGILQRLEGSGELLFLVKPRVNPGADTQFGPWAYRANAAQYFNLLWPVCLGFWWMYQRRVRGWRHHALLACAGLMAACPVISTSRGGALVTGGLALVSVLVLGAWHALDRLRHRAGGGRGTFAALAAFLGLVFALGLALGWKALEPRMLALEEGFNLREEMYANARPMARDYPVFGTGPGTFQYVFQLYRISTETYWPAQLHNDWLETRITYGIVGLSLLLAALAAVGARWFAGGGFYGGRRFVALAWLGLAGCLAHARFDFPFQIHSILFLFLLICAILFNVSRRP